MYNELYELWKQELESLELTKLPPNFYPRMAEYLRSIKEESRMLDKKTVKARLLECEMRNVKRMLLELIQARYNKLVKKAAKCERIPLEILSLEEKKIYTETLPIAEAYQNFIKNLLQGQFLNLEVEKEHKNVVLRFLMDVPAIIGADMKFYGPFKTGDVGSLPVENAKILIKQGLAEKVEVN
jgi:DNA replication factor GINS